VGQKSHPYGLRLGYIKDWKAKWFAQDKDFGKILIEDLKIRKLIKKELKMAGVADITIERSAGKVRVWIFSARPGIVIGRGGQEINKGEAGILGWAEAIEESFPSWKIYASDQLQDAEYGGDKTVEKLASLGDTAFLPELHLKTSMRSFRSEKVSQFVKEVLDLDAVQARETLKEINEQYPIVLSRDLNTAREWLRNKARGSERYGIVVSSQAERLRPLGVHVKAPINPVHWFLEGRDDVRSSYYLEEVATEFHVQGLELDWVCVVWDADFRYGANAWKNWSFRGNKWQQINKAERQMYQKNAYRVLLTRARQGMVIVVPEGDEKDFTRPAAFYDGTFEYLNSIGLSRL